MSTDTLIFGLQEQRNCDRREVRKVEHVENTEQRNYESIRNEY